MLSERFSSLFSLVAIEHFLGFCIEQDGQLFLGLGTAKCGAVFCGFIGGFIAGFGFALEAEVDDIIH